MGVLVEVVDFVVFLKKYKKRNIVKKRVVEFMGLDFEDDFEDDVLLKFNKGKIKWKI